MSIDAINSVRDEFSHHPMAFENMAEQEFQPEAKKYINLNQVRQAVEMANNGVSLDDEDIDFETIVTEMAKLIIKGQQAREAHFYRLSELGRTIWMSAVKRHAAEYSGTKWNIIGFPVVKSLLDVAQIGATIANAPAAAKVAGIMASFSETGKEYFATVDTGKRTELQAFVELSKLLFERNERENQNYSQQVQEAFRKYDDARRRREEIEGAMARA